MQMKSSVFKCPVNSTFLIKCTMIERSGQVKHRPGVRTPVLQRKVVLLAPVWIQKGRGVRRSPGPLSAGEAT